MRQRSLGKALATLTLAVMLAACAGTPQSDSLLAQQTRAPREPVLLRQVPFFPQELYQCGPAALATVLQTSGVAVTPEALVPRVYVPARQGSLQIEMIATARSHGRLVQQVAPSMEALLAEVQAGQPVLVLQNLALDWYPRWHYAVVKGFDLERGRLILNSGLQEDYAMPLRVFERTWARADHWGIVTLVPGTLPVSAEPGAYFSALAELTGHVAPQDLLRAYQAGVQRWPQERELQMGLGNLLASLGKHDAARAAFADVLQTHPQYAPAHNNLAHTLLVLGRPAEALPHAEQAVALGGELLPSYQATLRSVRAALP
jgi:hypothetical protein